MTPTLTQITQQTITVTHRAAEFILREFGRVSEDDIVTKSQNSLVSYVDREAEKILVAGLSDILPGCSFWTEEDTVEHTEGPWQWIIDPLDGTTNFLHGLPHFSVSVALRHHGELVVGVVVDVTKNETFSCFRGGGAYLNDKPIRVSPTGRLADALIATGFPYYDYSLVGPFQETLQYFMEHSRGLRRFGSAALDLAYVACGRYDFFFEYALHAWDMAAGILLVEEAGGQVRDFDGNSESLVRGHIAAGSTHSFDEAMAVVTRGFGRRAKPNK